MAASETCGQGIPCIYALLPNKKEKMDEKLFTINVKRAVGVDSSMETIITDSEKSKFKEVAKVFPDASHRGCRFHHNAAIFTPIGSKGLLSFFCYSPAFLELIVTNFHQFSSLNIALSPFDTK